MVELTQLNKVYHGRFVLEGISARINQNDRIGLIGDNGTGKSTLLRLICGYENADGGTITKLPTTSIGYLAQNSGLNTSNTIKQEMELVFERLFLIKQQLDELEVQMASNDSGANKSLAEKYAVLQTDYEQNGGYLIDVKINTVLAGMGFDDHSILMNVNSLSGGEKTRLAIAKLLLEEPNLLILDEPTNHLDFETLSWLENYINTTFSGSVLVVSHDRYFLDKCVNTIWEIENKTLLSFKGNYTKYVKLKQELNDRGSKEYEAQQKEIAKLQEYIDKNGTRASTAKSARSRKAALDRMDIIDAPQNFDKKININFHYDSQPFNDILDVKDMSITVGSDNSKKTLFTGLNLHLYRGEKLAIIGTNGIGKSSFLKAIQNMSCFEGKVKWGEKVVIGYYRQELTNLTPINSVIDELWDRYPAMLETDIRKSLAKVGLIGDNVFKKVGDLSGGEKARLSFAILMLKKPNVIILDEPTNHLDLTTRESLEKALIEFDGTLLTVSHDRYLLGCVPTKIMNLTSSGPVFTQGNYNDLVALEARTQKEEPIVESYNTNKPGAKLKRAERAKKRQLIKDLEQEIAELEVKTEELELEIVSQEVYNDYKLMESKCEELQICKDRHDEIFNDWVTLTEEEN